jgi:sugar O-acyltransferase (sialic acid O-acetyltransferase NeuD family)
MQPTRDSGAPGLWPADTTVVILGAGGLGREVLSTCYDLGVEDRILGFLDPDPELRSAVLDGKPVLGGDEWLAHCDRSRIRLLAAPGDNGRRREVTGQLEAAGWEPATLLSPTSVVSRFAHVGPGAVICAGTIVNTNVTLGSHCLLNPNCTVGHDARLHDFVQLAPGVHISGWVELGRGAYLGTGAAVSERLSVGEWSVVGSMAAVVDDLPDNVIAVGVPARVIRQRASG